MKNQKKILFLDHDIGASGSTVSMKYIVKCFIENNYKIYLLTRKPLGETKTFSNMGVNIVPYSSSPWKSIALSTHFSDDFKPLSKNWFITWIKNLLRVFIGLYTITRQLIKIKPNLLYINEHNMFYCAVPAKLLNIPAFIHIRSKYLSGRFAEKIISRGILAFNEKIYAISSIEANQLLKYVRKKSGKVEILPEFLSDDNFSVPFSQAEIRQKLNLPLNKFIVLSLSGIDRLKGTLDYLNCIDTVLRKNNNICFILAGAEKKTGAMSEVKEYYYQSDKILEKYIAENKIIRLGYCNNVSELLQAADVLVSSLSYSHFSRPVIEAWALKKAIVTSDTNHSRSFIEENENGVFYEPGDHTSLGKSILSLADDRILYNKISENGYIKAVNYFKKKSDPQIIIDHFTTL